MSKLFDWFKKGIIAAIILALGLAALPLAPVYAASNAQGETLQIKRWQARRLEWIWSRQQRVYARAGNQFDFMDKVIDKSQTLLEKARDKDVDVTEMEIALATYQQFVADAKVAFDGGQMIIDTHAGFDADGKVTDAAEARQSIDSLRNLIWDTRDAVHEANQALRQAYQDFRQKQDAGE